MDVVEFKKEHLLALDEFSATNFTTKSVATDAHYERIENQEHSYTVFIDGRPLLCAGVLMHWEGRGEAWAILDKNTKKHFLRLHNAVRRFLKICPVKRIEAVIDCDFEDGHRWAKSLGFKVEAECMKGYGIFNTKDCTLYARVRG